jgi:hypothetical protein
VWNLVRRIFGLVREELVGVWRRMHTKHCNLCASANIIMVNKSRRMRWVGHIAHMEELRNAYKILVRKPEGKRPLIRPRYKWEDNIGIDLKERGEKVWTGSIWHMLGTSGWRL